MKKIRLTESELVSLISRIIKEEKNDQWIQSAMKDTKKGKLTKFCGGKVTCGCVEEALNNKKMFRGAQLYLNMNPDKCTSLQ